MNLNSTQAKWRTMQDELIAHHSHTATVSYHVLYSGSPYDDYMNEGLDPNAPRTGLTGSSDATVVITGIAYLDVGKQTFDEAITYTHGGRFEPGKAIFLCKISDATIGGKNVFSNTSKVVLSVNNGKYIVENWISTGLGEVYVYQVFLKKTQ